MWQKVFASRSTRAFIHMLYRSWKIVNLPDFQEFKGKYYRFMPDEPVPAELRSLIIIPIVDNDSRPFRPAFHRKRFTETNFKATFEKILFTLVGNASVAINPCAGSITGWNSLPSPTALPSFHNHKHFQEQLAKELERTKTL